MATNFHSVERFFKRLFQNRAGTEILNQLAPNHSPAPQGFSPRPAITAKAAEQRWSRLADKKSARADLFDAYTQERVEPYSASIENFIGTAKIPVGVAGPLRVNGLFACGDYFVPLATTEAALVASYNRGAQLLTAAGGCTSAVISEGISRSPGFAFKNLPEVGTFVSWLVESMEPIKNAAQATTSHGKLIDMKVNIEGNHIYLNLEFLTGDAAGQNMVTIATEAVCEYVLEHCPVKPQYHFVEANFSGDKKASSQSFQSVRGKKVSAEAVLSEELIRTRLHSSPRQMVDYWRMSALGGVLSGTIGVQGHYANGLAAVYIACGQDAACVSESAVGVTRFEITDKGDLYAAVTLPNLIVGTVGGGTGLPTQRACLDILGLHGSGKAAAFAEVCAALVLGGELSIIGALSSGHFTRAHKHLARQRVKGNKA